MDLNAGCVKGILRKKNFTCDCGKNYVEYVYMAKGASKPSAKGERLKNGAEMEKL